MKLTYETLLDDPAILERVMANARRERAAAMHDMIVAPIARFFTAHAPRPHLARQG